MVSKKISMLAFGMIILTVTTAGVMAQEAAPAQVKSPGGQAAASLDPRALDMLKLMSDKLSQAKSVRFEARSMVPIKSPKGIRI